MMAAQPADPSHDLDLPFALGQPVRALSEYTVAGQVLAPERMIGVAGSRVLFANYRAIRADFPGLWSADSATDRSEAVIDRWLLQTAAFISTSQARAVGVTTPIPLDGRDCSAWRPPRYGRAAVLRDTVYGQGEIAFDVKGTGVPPNEMPVLPNSNGLLTLSEAIHEVLMEHLVLAAMTHAVVAVTPIPSYAVIDLGFDALWNDGRPPEPAVLLLRRTMTRPRCQWERAPQGRDMAMALLQVELLLRRYGLSSSSCGAVQFRVHRENGELCIDRDDVPISVTERVAENLGSILARANAREATIDGVNVQVAGALQDPFRLTVMDFGRYRFRKRFDGSLYSWFDADYQNLNGLFVSPQDASYVQPDPSLSLAGTPESESWVRLQAMAQCNREDVEPAEIAAALRATVVEVCRHLRTAP